MSEKLSDSQKREGVINTLKIELLDSLYKQIVFTMQAINDIRERCHCPSKEIIECLTKAVSDYHITTLNNGKEINATLYEFLSEEYKKDKCDYIGKPLLDILTSRS